MRTNGKPSVMAEQAGDDVIDGEIEELPPTRGGGGHGALATVGRPNMQRIQTQYTTAIRCEVKRDRKAVLAAVVEEAALAGEDFWYSWTQGKGKDRSIIEGTSIDGAMIMARNWGNCVPEIEIAQEAPTYWIFRSTFIDFETGMTLPRLFRKSKSGVHGKYDDERKLDIAMQIGQSKAQRNAIVKAMPTWLVSAALKAAKAAAAQQIVKDLPKAKADAVATFEKMKVTREQLETFIGAAIDQWNAQDIVRLRATYRAINDRQTTIENEFSPDAPEAGEAPKVTTPDKAAAEKKAEPKDPLPDASTNMFTGEPHGPPAATEGAAPAATAPTQPAPPESGAQATQAAAPPPPPPPPPPAAAEPPKTEAAPATPKESRKGAAAKKEREPGEEG